MAKKILLPFSTDTVTGASHLRVGNASYPGCLSTDDQDNTYVEFIGDAALLMEFDGTMDAVTSIESVTVKANQRIPTGYTDQTIRLGVRINGNSYYSDPLTPASGNWEDVEWEMTTNPDTSVAWVIGDITAPLFCWFEYYDSLSKAVRVSYFRCEVAYTPVDAAPGDAPPEPPVVGGSAYEPSWIGTYSQVSDPGATSGGVFKLDKYGNIEDVAVPEGITGISGKTSFAKWMRGDQRRIYMNGGHTENIVYLEPGRVSRLDISVIGNALVGSASPTGTDIGIVADSGGTITGSAIVYLRWRDSVTGRRSPLSEGFALTLTNNKLHLYNVPSGPDVADAFVDRIEVWISLAGGYPRMLESFVLPDSEFVTSTNIQGAAEITAITAFPTCKYNAIYHDRLVMAGDPANPEVVYFSGNGDMEVHEGLTLSTRSGEAIRGLFVIRDILVVMCDNSMYAIQGYDENDITMSVLSSSVGGLGHHTVVALDDLAIFFSRTGLYMTNGSSVTPIGAGQFNETWAREQHWILFDGSRFGFCMHDSENKIIKYKTPSGSQFSPMAGLSSANVDGIVWIVDYKDLVNGVGGVKLSIDTVAGTSSTEPTASSMLMDDTGAMRLYTGHASGKIAKDGVFGMNDIDHAYEYVWQSPQIEIAEPGDDADCASVVKVWFYMMNEDVPIEWTIFAGNQYDWQAQKIEGLSGGRSATGTIAPAAESIGSAARVYRDRVIVHPEAAAGSTVSVLLKMTPARLESIHAAYLGAPRRADGEVFAAPLFSIRGWGFSFQTQGEETRSLRPIVAEYTFSD